MRRTGLRLAAITLLIGSAVWGLNPASAEFRAVPMAQATQAARSAAISAERISGHVSYLASDRLQGRRAGTPAAAEAARYIAREFERYGLKPASPKGFLQPFAFISDVKLGGGNSFTVKRDGGPRPLKVGADFMPQAFSSSSPAAGQVVFVGYGISAPELQYDSYSGIDPAGKIVMILRGSPDGDNPHGRFAEYTQPGMEIQKKTLKAREKGASGIIFVSSEANFRDDALAKLRHDINFLDAGIPAVAVSRAAAESLLLSARMTLADAERRAKESPAPLALENVSVSFRTDVVKVEGKDANVIAVLPGSDPRLASEYVVIGAHYDHLGLGGQGSLAEKEGGIHHGADDNASGTAALLELARVLAAERAKVKRSVMFIAFGAEELGLLGSAAYTKAPPAPLASVVAMLNMDMVGRLRNNAFTIGGVGTSPAWKPLLEKLNAAAEDAGNGEGKGSRFTLRFSQDGFGPSDHQSFYVRNIPVLFFFTGSHEDYHKPSDTADKVNAEGVRQIAEFVREIAVSVANENERIAFTRVKRETPTAGRGFRVYLGTVPSYVDQTDGMKLDGVRPESPAEKAGLRAGDVIIRLGKTAIKNVYDYTNALSELRAGEEVEVIVRRDGREMTLKITPARRQ
ncbi:MAG TPA: M20/M25/M40 family metallo-hydrolase [Blastocatellia bacterium]|nr:M20/M25/M40 family metallo-hydrolase [Blastocatellia bacterium]